MTSNVTAAIADQKTGVEWDFPIITWMVIAHTLALASLPFFTWQNLSILIVLHYITTSWGIGLCFHRMLSHRAIRMSKFWERVFATIGVLTLQGSPLRWVATHRLHHAFSDQARDPHDSHQGFWYSHFVWMIRKNVAFADADEMRRFARDISADPYYRWLESFRNQTILQVILALAIWGIFDFGAMMWGTFLRITLVYHCTWLVNSATHQWGYRSFPDSPDNSRNNWWVTLLTWGEGWHNNHHADESLATMGRRRWEFDITMMMIKFLSHVGVVKTYNSNSIRA